MGRLTEALVYYNNIQGDKPLYHFEPTGADKKAKQEYQKRIKKAKKEKQNKQKELFE